MTTARTPPPPLDVGTMKPEPLDPEMLLEALESEVPSPELKALEL
jgi:hypothetical protein